MTEGLRTESNRIPFGAKEMCCGFRAQKKGMTSAIPYYDWIKSSNMSVFLLYLFVEELFCYIFSFSQRNFRSE